MRNVKHWKVIEKVKLNHIRFEATPLTVDIFHEKWQPHAEPENCEAYFL